MLAIIELLVVCLFIFDLEDIVDIAVADEELQQFPPVSIVVVNTGNHQGTVGVFAEITPRWQASLKAHVKGEVLSVMPQAIAGRNVTKGETLIKIEDSLYQAQRYEAEQLLAEAKLQLLQEQKKSGQAKRDWKRSGLTTKPSDLTLNIPQLALAEKKVTAAKSNLRAAQQNLQYTIVTSPFSGFVTTRHISLGQTVEEGDVLLDVIGNEQSEVSVSLSEKQWRLLDKNWQDNKAIIYHEDGRQLATATITDGGDFIDPDTRQYKLFLKIDLEENIALAGSFINVSLPAKLIKNSLKIPESSISRDGYVWFIDNNNKLQRFVADVILRSHNEAVVHQPMIADLEPHKSAWQVAITPLASFIVGSQVEPSLVGGA